MALLDLSQITRILVNLLKKNIEASPIWPTGVTLSVVPDPPDKLTGTNMLGVYLYHILEDPGNKNLESIWEKPTHIRYAPMPLQLFYVLTAHSDGESSTVPDTYQEQLIMGCALKAMHDFPLINDETQLQGQDLIPSALQDKDNRFQIEMRPVQAEEAVQYWTAGSSPLRLAAYYQVSIVMLEPEESPSRSGRVLIYDVFAFPGETPYLISSSNVLTFTLPGETKTREVTLRPAQVPFGGTVYFDGTSLSGERTTLLLSHANWDNPIEVDSLAWSLQVGVDRLTAVIQNTADTAGAIMLVPGMYAAMARVMRSRLTASGGTRSFEYLSNETPFAISPQISSITVAPTTGVWTVIGRVFQAPGILQGAITVYIGETLLVAVSPAPSPPPLSAGQFSVVSPSQISLRLPQGLASGEQVPFRLIINGAESPPNWIQVP